MLTVRRANPTDATGITIVNVYVWKTAYAGLVPDALIDGRIQKLRERAEITRQTIVKDDNFFVAEEDGAVVGFCMYGPARSEAHAGAGEIYALYVLDGYHGTGVGRRLFEAGAQALVGMGFDRMIINCLKGNPALGFYQKMGGVVLGERTDEVAGVMMTETVLTFDGLATFARGNADENAASISDE